MPDSQSQHLDQAIDSTMSQGRRALARLAKEAEAARAEARYEELRLLVEEADRGNRNGLERWLETNDIDSGSSFAADESSTTVETAAALDSSAAAATQRRVTPAPQLLKSSDGKQNWKLHPNPLADTVPQEKLATSQALESAEQLASWDSLLPLARTRLKERLSARGKLSPSSVPTKQKTPRSKSPKKQPKSRQASKESRQKIASSGDSPSPNRPNAAVVQLAQSMQNADDKNQQEQSPWYKRLGGVGVSLLAHVGIIIVLAFVTLNLPTDAASLALNAASANSDIETVEISESFDVSEPSDVAEPTIQEPVVDASESLSDSSDALSDLLASEAPANVSSGAANAMRAISAGAAAKMRAATSSFYGAQASGNCFCYIIDGSGSMRNGPWDAAKLELLKSLASLKPKQRFYIIFFNREMNAIPLPGERDPAPKTLYATRENLQHAREWIETLKIDAGAPPNDALEHAIGLEPDAIYLLTDGVTKVDVPAFLTRVNRVEDLIFGTQVRVPIHTIAFYSREGEAKLRRIAAENKGQFIYVPDPRGR